MLKKVRVRGAFVKRYERDEAEAHRQADRERANESEAKLRMPLARWKAQQEREKGEEVKLAETRHGHEFSVCSDRCSHCGLSRLDYHDSLGGIDADLAMVCTSLSDADRPLSVREIRRQQWLDSLPPS